MKIINLYIVLLFLATSCSSSFLDRSPESNISGNTFFQTEDDFTQAVNGIYGGVRGVTQQANWLMGEQRSDNVHYVTNGTDRGKRYMEDLSNFVDDPTNLSIAEFYNNSYSAIAKTNTVIDRIQTTTFSKDFVNKTVGQAKFLRAYFYFNLVQYYGGVPLQLKEVGSAGESFIKRSTVEEVYAQIMKDLDDADAALAAPTFPQDGHVSKGAVEMLYARVLMTAPKRDYAKAETLLKQVLNMGYGFVGTYADAFNLGNKNSVESIFEVQFKTAIKDQGSNYIYTMMPLTADGQLITGWAGSNNSSNGGWCVPTKEMINSYEPGDTRLDYCVKVAIGTINPASNWMTIDQVVSLNDPILKTSVGRNYFVNKYNHPHDQRGSTDDNWPIFRYSDALLSLAECYVEDGGDPNRGLPLVNQVRQRAGIPNVMSIDATVVANERRHEFAFEAKRWLDLVRTGKAITTMNAFGITMKALDPSMSPKAYNVTADRLIYPIPYREVITGGLQQNPGY